jgi:hypothetical protein
MDLTVSVCTAGKGKKNRRRVTGARCNQQVLHAKFLLNLMRDIYVFLAKICF